MKPKPITAYAIVDKKKPVLKYKDIIARGDEIGISLNEKTEKIVKVKITVV